MTPTHTSMETLSKILLVGFGGFIGANGRYWLGGVIQARSGPAFPWNTFLINVSGSFLIGLLMALILGLQWGRSWQIFLVTGILGGYTTFSSFSYEALGLISEKSYLYAMNYIFGSVFLSLGATWIGVILGRLLGGKEI